MAELVLAVLVILILIVLGSLAYASFSAAPWVPLRKRDIQRLIDLAKIKPGERVYDLGCGDGRVLAAVVKQTGGNAVGFEVAVLPYVFAKLRTWMPIYKNRMQVKFTNFYEFNLAGADVIFCFLTPYAMVKLEAKINSELKPGARFLSYAFPLPTKTPTLTEKHNPKTARIFLYS